jgi:hypothetical protein
MRLKAGSVAAAVLVVVLVAVAAGCGGGSKSSSPTVETTATVDNSATTSGSASSSGSSKSSSTPSFTSAKNCKDLAAIGAKLSQAMQSSSGNENEVIANEAKALEQLASSAPGEIRDDFKVLADAFSTYVGVIQKTGGLKPGKVPSAAQVAQLTKAAQAFSSAKLQQAEQHLTAWAQKNCQGVVPTTGG